MYIAFFKAACEVKCKMPQQDKQNSRNKLKQIIDLLLFLEKVQVKRLSEHIYIQRIWFPSHFRYIQALPFQTSTTAISKLLDGCTVTK